MNDLIPFDFEKHQIRALLIDGAPWWMARDVAQVLGYKHVPHMLRLLEDDEKGVHIVDTLGGRQTAKTISLSGVFMAIINSRRAEAVRFRRWLTGEVLPTLFRTGSYTMPGSDRVADRYRLLGESEPGEGNDDLLPRVKAMLADSDSLTVTELADAVRAGNSHWKRERIHLILRTHGWLPRIERQRGQLVEVFHRPAGE